MTHHDPDLEARARAFAETGRSEHERQPRLVNVPEPGGEAQLIAVLIDIILATCVVEVPAQDRAA